MAQLKKISNTELDTNKSVIICGKGPSISNINEFIDQHSYPKPVWACLQDFYFFSINTAYRLMPKADFIVASDLNVFDDIDKEPAVYESVKNYIVPLVFRHNLRWDIQGGQCVDSDKTYHFILDKLKSYDINVYTYKLFTQTLDVDVDNTQQDDFLIEHCFSNYQCTLEWCIRAGFTDYKVFGVSKKNEYAQTFVDNKEDGHRALNRHSTTSDNGDSFYESNYNASIDLLEKHNCTYKIF